MYFMNIKMQIWDEFTKHLRIVYVYTKQHWANKQQQNMFINQPNVPLNIEVITQISRNLMVIC